MPDVLDSPSRASRAAGCFARSGRRGLVKAPCPEDGHLRVLNRQTGQLGCPDPHCVCLHCHLWLTPDEQREWPGQ